MDVPYQPFVHGWIGLITLPLKVFTQRNFAAGFFVKSPIFIRKMKKIAFETPFGG